MRGLITIFAAAVLLCGCSNDEEDVHTRHAHCVAQRALAQSSPGQPAGEWPVNIEVDALDLCTGETYGPLVEEQLAANPDDRDDLESRFVSNRLLDIITVAEHPAECEDLLACATGQLRYNTYGDCLQMTSEADVQDEAENLLGCDGSLSDTTTQVTCADFVRSALLTSIKACY
jgi:hypothetical protein